MREFVGNKTLDDLFKYLSDMSESGAKINVKFADDDGELPFADDDICPYDGDCEDCPYEKQCAEDMGLLTDDDETDMWGVPDIDHIVFSGPATVVFWADGDKTVVKCMPGERFERYAGFAAACMKKMFGSTSRAKAIMADYTVEQVVKEKKEKKEEHDERAVVPGNLDETIKEAVNEALER